MVEEKIFDSENFLDCLKVFRSSSLKVCSSTTENFKQYSSIRVFPYFYFIMGIPCFLVCISTYMTQTVQCRALAGGPCDNEGARFYLPADESKEHDESKQPNHKKKYGDVI